MSFGDWIGTNFIAPQKRSFKKFKDAKKFVHSLGLTRQIEWAEYSAGKRKDLQPRPIDIPSNPQQVYKSEWVGIRDWLGVEEAEYLAFKKCRSFIRRLKLKSMREFRAYAKGALKEKLLPPFPTNIPRNPQVVYKNEWVDWYDFLGKKR